MLALFSNLSFSEVIVVLVIALLVFGKRLPEVAVRASTQFVKARRTLSDMWRQTGLEDELRRVRRDIESEQRRIETGLPDWRKELPDWKKFESGARSLEAEVTGNEPPKLSAGPPASGSPSPQVPPTPPQATGPMTVSPLRDLPVPKSHTGTPPAAPARVIEPEAEPARSADESQASQPAAPAAGEENA